MQCGGFSGINLWNSFVYIEIFKVIFAYYVQSDDRSCVMDFLIPQIRCLADAHPVVARSADPGHSPTNNLSKAIIFH